MAFTRNIEMKENEEEILCSEELQATAYNEKCLTKSDSLTDVNKQSDYVDEQKIEKNEMEVFLPSNINNSNKLLELFNIKKGEPSKELAALCALTINTAVALVKLALFLVWHTRSFTTYGCKNMKEFIQHHTSITYDAGIKQLEAARICAELFGLSRMGDFSDSALRTLAKLPEKLRSKVVDNICEECNVDRTTISKKDFTTNKVEMATKNVTGRNLFNLSTKRNYMEQEIVDKNFCSISSTFLDGHSKIYGLDGIDIEDDSDLCVINFDVDYSNIHLNHDLRFKYSELEMLEIIKCQFSEFYKNHVLSKGVSRSELILIIVSLGQKKLDEASVVELININYREGAFLNKEHAYESLQKYSKKILYLLINILDERGTRKDSFNLLPSIKEDECSSEELIDLIINKYHVFDDYNCQEYLPTSGRILEDEDEDEDEDFSEFDEEDENDDDDDEFANYNDDE